VIDAFTTERTPPQWIGDEGFKKKSLSAMPFERPKTGVHRQAIFWFWFEQYAFMLFLQSKKKYSLSPPPILDTHATGSVEGP
jgi:hypothetical protein